mmetsp:Transcript_36664/g.74437  ORF Transcript_36664/g.74437 Transcript_36664/m.74437 type:complete len:206 (+) Transcript_36664:1337-1954(+)
MLTMPDARVTLAPVKPPSSSHALSSDSTLTNEAACANDDEPEVVARALVAAKDVRAVPTNRLAVSETPTWPGAARVSLRMVVRKDRASEATASVTSSGASTTPTSTLSKLATSACVTAVMAYVLQRLPITDARSASAPLSAKRLRRRRSSPVSELLLLLLISLLVASITCLAPSELPLSISSLVLASEMFCSSARLLGFCVTRTA